MDPKTTTNLDPKLKDMYDRVMNTAIPPPVSPSPIQDGGPVVPPPPPGGITSSFPASDQTQLPAQPIPPSLNETPLNQASQDQQQNSNPFLTPTPSTPPAPVAPTPLQPETQPSTPIQSEPTTEMQAAIPIPVVPKPISAAIIGGSAKSKNMKLFPVLLALGVIIFFAIYAVFWVKFFNLSVPFLPF